jgi:hypothetical protein
MSPVRTASRSRAHENLSLANPIAAGANRPPDRVLPRLRGGDLALNPREQLLRFRERRSQIGDIAEVIWLADLHDVHAATPAQGQEQKYPARTDTASCAPVSGEHLRWRDLFGRFVERAPGGGQPVFTWVRLP